jgi:hypothetical protein
VLVQATAIGIATQPLEVSDADCSASPSPDQYPNFRRQLRVRRHLCVVERYWPFAGLGELVLRSHIVELDPMHVLARQERIGFLIYAPGIAGGDLERAREEIDALRNIDGAAADEMQQQLALRVEKNRRAADRSDG